MAPTVAAVPAATPTTPIPATAIPAAPIPATAIPATRAAQRGQRARVLCLADKRVDNSVILKDYEIDLPIMWKT